MANAVEAVPGDSAAVAVVDADIAHLRAVAPSPGLLTTDDCTFHEAVHKAAIDVLFADAPWAHAAVLTYPLNADAVVATAVIIVVADVAGLRTAAAAGKRLLSHGAALPAVATVVAAITGAAQRHTGFRADALHANPGIAALGIGKTHITGQGAPTPKLAGLHVPARPGFLAALVVGLDADRTSGETFQYAVAVAVALTLGRGAGIAGTTFRDESRRTAADRVARAVDAGIAGVAGDDRPGRKTDHAGAILATPIDKGETSAEGALVIRRATGGVA
jgi:hypothetical protein